MSGRAPRLASTIQNLSLDLFGFDASEQELGLYPLLHQLLVEIQLSSLKIIQRLISNDDSEPSRCWKAAGLDRLSETPAGRVPLG